MRTPTLSTAVRVSSGTPRSPLPTSSRLLSRANTTASDLLHDSSLAMSMTVSTDATHTLGLLDGLRELTPGSSIHAHGVAEVHLDHAIARRVLPRALTGPALNSNAALTLRTRSASTGFCAIGHHAGAGAAGAMGTPLSGGAFVRWMSQGPGCGGWIGFTREESRVLLNELDGTATVSIPLVPPGPRAFGAQALTSVPMTVSLDGYNSPTAERVEVDTGPQRRSAGSSDKSDRQVNIGPPLDDLHVVSIVAEPVKTSPDGPSSQPPTVWIRTHATNKYVVARDRPHLLFVDAMPL
jgi:hypothetical protein